jgi:hypothetical protein
VLPALRALETWRRSQATPSKKALTYLGKIGYRIDLSTPYGFTNGGTFKSAAESCKDIHDPAMPAVIQS